MGAWYLYETGGFDLEGNPKPHTRAFYDTVEEATIQAAHDEALGQRVVVGVFEDEDGEPGKQVLSPAKIREAAKAHAKEHGIVRGRSWSASQRPGVTDR